MFNRDRINDEYEVHQLRFGSRAKDELEILPVDVRIYRLRWYNEFLAHIGEGLIAAGRLLKERNADVKTNLSFHSYGD